MLFFFLKLLAVQQGTGDLTSLTRDCCVARHGGSYFPHQGLLCSKARGILLPSPGIEPACLKVKVQSRPILCDPMDCSLPGSSVHGIFQAIVLEWIAISFSRGSSQPRDWTLVSRIIDRCFTIWATREIVSPDKYFRRMKAEWGCCQEIFKNISKYKWFCSKQFYIIIKDSSKLNYWISR